MLGSEVVYADEMKDTVNNSFLMDYIITELLVDDELIDIQKQFENKLDNLIKNNVDMYNELMDETLVLNSNKRTKDVYITTHSPKLLNMLNINFDNLFIFNDAEYKGPKKINFKKAVSSLPQNVNIENLYSNSKTYYYEEKLKEFIKNRK